MWLMSGNERNVEVKLIRMRQVLVASLNSATPPLFWQFDLEKNHSFTLSLREAGTEWELGVATPRHDFLSVCRFSSRIEAEEAYTALAAELMKRRSRPRCRWWICVLLIILAVVGAVVLSGASSGVLSSSPISTGASGDAPQRKAGDPPLAIRNSVPMLADDVLPNPPE